MKKNTLIVIWFFIVTQTYCQQWFPMGNIDTTVSFNGHRGLGTVNLFNNKIIIGGYFKYTGTTVLNSIAQWNGNQWTPMSTGIWQSSTSDGAGSCHSLKEYHNKLYCTGGFEGAGGVMFNVNHHAYNIAKWDTTDWYYLTQPADGVNSGAGAMGIYNNNLYIGHAGGNAFDSSGVIAAQGIVRWNDTVFSAVGQFAGDFPIWGDFYASAFTNYNNKLIVGGAFTSINGSPYGVYNGIATWDDTTWGTMGNGFNNAVFSLVVFNGELYAAGCFTSSRDGTAQLNHIAKWTGTTWAQVGEGLNDTVYALTVDSVHNKLYAGGGFTQTGLGVSAKHIAEWTGSNWQEVGGGTNRTVGALYSKDSNLYVGGLFTRAGNVQASLIACWCVNSPLGITENNKEENGVFIYPNPSSGAFTIESTSKIESIKVFNLIGETIYQTTKDNLQSSINLSSQPKGIYFVQVKTEKGILNRKIVIQ